MHKLNTNFVAVGFFVSFNKISEHPLLLLLGDGTVQGHLNVKLTVHIGLSKAVACRIEQVMQRFIWEAEFIRKTWAIFIVFLEVKRVDVRDEMTVSHESSQKHLQSHQFICLSRV